MIKLLLPILLAVLFLSGCQKELSIENGGGTTTPTPVPTDSIYLEKALLINDYGVSGIDSTVLTFKYDNNRRVNTYLEKNYSSGALDDSTLIFYYYNGTDTLPFKYKATGGNLVLNLLDTANCFINYDLAGNVLSDSTVITQAGTGGYYLRFKQIRSRQYNAGFFVTNGKTTGLLVPPGTSVDNEFLDSAWVDGSSNIIKEVNYDLFGALPSVLTYKGNYTYDNRSSPYRRLNIFNLLHDAHYSKAEITPQVNNYVSFHAEDILYGLAVYTENYANIFNNIGLLSVASGNGSETGTNYMIANYYYYRHF